MRVSVAAVLAGEVLLSASTAGAQQANQIVSPEPAPPSASSTTAPAATTLPEVTVEAKPVEKQPQPKKHTAKPTKKTAAAAPKNPATEPLPSVPGTAIIDNLPPAYAGGQVASGAQLGILGNRDVMDAPFSVTSYTEDYLRDQQASTLADVVDTDPSVRINNHGRGSNNGGGDVFTIRGFTVPNSDTSFNGLYGVLPVGTISLSGVERVEIFKGPNAMLNGMSPSGGVGGTINIVPKRAGDEPLTRLTTGFESSGSGSAELDVGRRYGTGKEFGVRFNGLYQNGDTAVDDQTNEVQSATLGLDFRGSAVRLSADLGYQKDRTDVPSSWGGGLRIGGGVTHIPDAPNASNRTAQLWEYIDNEDLYGVVRGEVDVTRDITVYAAAGGRTNDQADLRTSSRLNDNSGSLLTQILNYPQYSDSESYQGGIKGVLRFGSVRHEWNIGATRLSSEVGYGLDVLGGGLSDLYHVAEIPKPDTSSLSDARKNASTDLTSVAFADTMVFADDRVWLTLGVRRQYVDQDNYDVTSGARTSTYDESATTPSVGLVVKPWHNVSLYGNYIEGLTQGMTAPAGTENAGEVFPPTKTRQAEAGVKVDFGKVTGTLGVFRIEQPNAITIPGSTSASTIYTIDGQQLNKGVEFNVFGELTPSIRLLGGVTYLDPEQTKTQGGLNDGKDAIGVANWNGNVGVEWDPYFAKGVTLSARSVITGTQYADAANKLELPAWARLDLGVRYKLEDRPIEFRANVYNVLDTNYWETADPSTGLRLGAPRTFILSMSTEF
ncbi:TonB-dependent outer membrane receptor [Hyphomicrobium sp. MC1]|uniref:TonB-dependent receptor n=1 Tax=Hyphomicrobium sp. 802 TaxID=1112272 RepID=UPI000213E8E9|nr:TonB-dependent receptor [Hyphomicrobium sp. 802]CCB65964.1 TonB-dependent outer membrane receptor [Hyphomicrobium sp. MC1]